MDKPFPPLRLGYAVRNTPAAGFLFLIDRAVVPCLKRFSSQPSPAPAKPTGILAPERILISNVGGGMGDVVMATSIIPVLKSAFPGVELGFLAGPAMMPAVHGHPDLFRLHHYDHFLRKPRKPANLLKIMGRTKRLIAELHATAYDWAIELFPGAQNTILFCYLAGIPTRAGYTTGAWGGLLTNPLKWTQRDRHITEYHKDLLRDLGIAEKHLSLCHETLPPVDPKKLPDILSLACAHPRGMVLCHPGSSNKAKEWPAGHWAEVAKDLARQGSAVVFTGAGSRQKHLIDKILKLAGCGVSVCNMLEWEEFVTAVSVSRLVISADSAAQHVAAAFDRHCVVVGTGINPGNWFPRHLNHRYLLHPTPCSPCFRPGMCRGRECLVLVQPEQVVAAVNDLLRLGQQSGSV